MRRPEYGYAVVGYAGLPGIWIPACAGMTVGELPPYAYPVIPVPLFRHSRESGNPHPAAIAPTHP